MNRCRRARLNWGALSAAGDPAAFDARGLAQEQIVNLGLKELVFAAFDTPV